MAAEDAFGRPIPPNVRMSFARDVLAGALREYGEDELAGRALELTDAELEQVQRVAVWHRENDAEPAQGPKLTNGRIMARAMIELVEGRPRDTRRSRRRVQR